MAALAALGFGLGGKEEGETGMPSERTGHAIRCTSAREKANKHPCLFMKR